MSSGKSRFVAKQIGEILRHPFKAVRRAGYAFLLSLDARSMPCYYRHCEEVAARSTPSKLNALGRSFGTDKADLLNKHGGAWLGHDYLRHYDVVLSSLRENAIDVLEFGCGQGGSLKTWKAYFPNARITGVDLDENAKQFEEERVRVLISDATDEKTYEALTAENDNIMLIVDDASHAWGDQRRSLELFWPALKSGGYYIIEDLEMGAVGAYPEYPPQVFDAQPFHDYLKDRVSILRCSGNCLPEVNRPLFDQLPERVQAIERELDMLLFIPGAAILRKK